MQFVAARLSTGRIISFAGNRPDKMMLINVLFPAFTGPMKTMRNFSCCSTRRARASILVYAKHRGSSVCARCMLGKFDKPRGMYAKIATRQSRTNSRFASEVAHAARRAGSAPQAKSGTPGMVLETRRTQRHFAASDMHKDSLQACSRCTRTRERTHRMPLSPRCASVHGSLDVPANSSNSGSTCPIGDLPIVIPKCRSAGRSLRKEHTQLGSKPNFGLGRELAPMLSSRSPQTRHKSDQHPSKSPSELRRN